MKGNKLIIEHIKSSLKITTIENKPILEVDPNLEDKIIKELKYLLKIKKVKEIILELIKNDIKFLIIDGEMITEEKNYQTIYEIFKKHNLNYTITN